MSRRVRLSSLLLSTVVAFSACTTPALTVADLEMRLAESSRSDADKARDAGRKPAEVVAFLAITPGMTVLDVVAASGYYTEVLSIAVGPTGQVYAQNNEFVLKIRDGVNDKAMTARLAGSRLPNVKRADADLSEISVSDGSVDVAITALNFHDFYNSRGEQAALDLLTSVYRKLKPGGVFGIIDHVGDPGQDNKALHRIEKRRVLDVIAKTRFSLDAESDVLSNDMDDHTQSVFAAGVRGKTDRFLLRLRKPRV